MTPTVRKSEPLARVIGVALEPPNLGRKPPTTPSEVLPVLLPWAKEMLGGRRLAALGHRVVQGGVRHTRHEQGENAATVRASILQGCRWLGLELDGSANRRHGPLISKAGSRVAAYVISTDENLMIARHTRALSIVK